LGKKKKRSPEIARPREPGKNERRHYIEPRVNTTIRPKGDTVGKIQGGTRGRKLPPASGQGPQGSLGKGKHPEAPQTRGQEATIWTGEECAGRGSKSTRGNRFGNAGPAEEYCGPQTKERGEKKRAKTRGQTGQRQGKKDPNQRRSLNGVKCPSDRGKQTGEVRKQRKRWGCRLQDLQQLGSGGGYGVKRRRGTAEGGVVGGRPQVSGGKKP